MNILTAKSHHEEHRVNRKPDDEMSTSAPRSSKVLGIIGGLGPESTVLYYRQVLSRYRAMEVGARAPSILIFSVDMTYVLGAIAREDFIGLVNYLSTGLERLSAAGATFALIAANTPHIVFDELQQRSSIKLISIVEAVAAAAQAIRLSCLGLLGTEFTMSGKFYPDVLNRTGITVVAPDAADRSYIHEKYLGELVNGAVNPGTRSRFIAVVNHMKDRYGIDGLILGGTELSLMFDESTLCGIPVLDTTRIHVQAAVDELRA